MTIYPGRSVRTKVGSNARAMRRIYWGCMGMGQARTFMARLCSGCLLCKLCDIFQQCRKIANNFVLLASPICIAGVGSKGEKNRLKNRLRLRLRLNFDSMTCVNYLFLDFFQYRKSQADSQANSQADFQAVFPPLDPTPGIRGI